MKGRINMNLEKSTKTIAVLEIITAIGLILFWILFFTVGLAPADPPVGYFEYEHSFPLPDIILSLTLIAAGYFLLKKKGIGKSLSLVCAGGLLFLGIIDFSFNIQNGVYTVSTMDLITNGFINIWCVLFGLFIIRRLQQR
jgi:hypothetical protein